MFSDISEADDPTADVMDCSDMTSSAIEPPAMLRKESPTQPQQHRAVETMPADEEEPPRIGEKFLSANSQNFSPKKQFLEWQQRERRLQSDSRQLLDCEQTLIGDEDDEETKRRETFEKEMLDNRECLQLDLQQKLQQHLQQTQLQQQQQQQRRRKQPKPRHVHADDDVTVGETTKSLLLSPTNDADAGKFFYVILVDLANYFVSFSTETSLFIFI